MGSLKRGRHKLLFLVLAMLGVVIAAPAVASTNACTGDYPVTIDQLLLNPNPGFTPSEATIALATPIPAGDYTLSMLSFDDHDSKPNDQTDQLNEQWFLQLFDSAGIGVANAMVADYTGGCPSTIEDTDGLTLDRNGGTVVVTGDRAVDYGRLRERGGGEREESQGDQERALHVDRESRLGIGESAATRDVIPLEQS